MAGSKGSKYYDIFLDYSITLNHREKGKIIDLDSFTLLKNIEATGSLKQAAISQEISYRKAWGILQEIEQSLNLVLVSRQRGGSDGGKTTLTEDGFKLINAHKELSKEFNKAIHNMTKKFFHELNQ